MKSTINISELVRTKSRRLIPGSEQDGYHQTSDSKSKLNLSDQDGSDWRISFRALGQLDSKESCREKILTSDNRPSSYGSADVKRGANQPGDDSDKNSRSINIPDDSENFSVADIIGSFGWFQFIVLLFSGLREASVGYDAVVMSIILQPESNFLCADNLVPGFQLPSANSSIKLFSPEHPFNETAQCFRYEGGKVLLDLATGDPVRCKSWLFPHLEQGASLVAEWSLVCDKHWMVAFIESAYFFGLVTGNLIWGYYADKVGRKKAYLIAHTIALIAGWSSVFMPYFALFTLCRFFSAFGSIGYNIIYSIQVELIGTKHRAFSTTLNHLGWGLGVICVPIMSHLFTNYRYIIVVGPLLTLVM